MKQRQMCRGKVSWGAYLVQCPPPNLDGCRATFKNSKLSRRPPLSALLVVFSAAGDVLMKEGFLGLWQDTLRFARH